MDPQIEAQIAAQRRQEQEWAAWSAAQPSPQAARAYTAPGDYPAASSRSTEGPAVCDVELGPAQGTCGVGANGRCVDCGRAFCPSHQGRATDGMPFNNLCSLDLARRYTAIAQADAAARARNEEEQRQRHQRALDDLAAAKRQIVELAGRLRSAGSPGLQRRFKVIGQRQLIPGISRFRDVRKEIEPGWLVGRFDWNVHNPERSGYFEAPAHDTVEGRQTYVLPSGRVVTDQATGLSGRAIEPANLESWQAIAKAFAKLVDRT